MLKTHLITFTNNTHIPELDIYIDGERHENVKETKDSMASMGLEPTTFALLARRSNRLS